MGTKFMEMSSSKLKPDVTKGSYKEQEVKSILSCYEYTIRYKT